MKSEKTDEIADMADRGEDVSQYFTNQGAMEQPIKRVNVDFTAAELNVNRQAVIKSYLRQALDQHRLAKRQVR